MTVKFTARRLRTGDPRRLLVELPRTVADQLVPLYYKSEQRCGDYLSFVVGLPHAARTTGERSQNHAINGGIAQVWERSGANGTMTFDAFKLWIKWKAIPSWPYEAAPDGTMLPKSEADISIEEAAIFIDWLRMFAGENGIDLEGFLD